MMKAGVMMIAALMMVAGVRAESLYNTTLYEKRVPADSTITTNWGNISMTSDGVLQEVGFVYSNDCEEVRTWIVVRDPAMNNHVRSIVKLNKQTETIASYIIDTVNRPFDEARVLEAIKCSF